MSSSGLLTRASDGKTLPTFGKLQINYSVLKKLCSIDGLGNRTNYSSNDAHVSFMKNYSEILNCDEKLPSLDIITHRDDRITRKLDNCHQNGVEMEKSAILIPHGHCPAHYCSGFEYSVSHNIKDHLGLLHWQPSRSRENDVLSAKSHSLKMLLQKLPFERTQSDQDAIYHHLLHFTELTSKIPLKILRELSAVIQVEKWNAAGYTVFYHRELFLILKGSVELNDEIPGEISDGVETKKLNAGQCFGNITSTESDETNPNCKPSVSLAKTLEPCELVKITSRDFQKRKKLVDNKIRKENLDLLQSCGLFKKCSKPALTKISRSIHWKRFARNTVLAKEGESSRVIAFISEGSCRLQQSVHVSVTNTDGTKGRVKRQVTVGDLEPGDSFGERSVLCKRHMPYTVITSSTVRLGLLAQQHFDDMDDVTKSLISQGYNDIDDNLTEECLQERYILQQKRKEWERFKRKTVDEVIFYRLINPGFGKWSRNPTNEDVASTRSPNIPERSPNIHGRSPNIPERTPNIPERSPNIPERTPDIPERSPSIPEGRTGDEGRKY